MKRLFLLLALGVVAAAPPSESRPTERIKVAKGPHFSALSVDGDLLFVTSYVDSEIQVIDTRTFRPLRTFYGGYEPVGIAVTPDGAKLFVTSLNRGLVKAIDATTFEILDDIKVEGRPSQVLVAPNGLHAMVLNFGRGKIGRVDFVDTTTHRIAAEVEIGIRPLAGAIIPLADQLFVACSGSNDVYVLDINRRTVIKSIPVGLAPDGVAVSPDGLTVYVANSGTNDVSVIDALDLEEIRRVPVGAKPFSMTVDSAGRLYVVETGDKRVSVYDSDFNRLFAFRASKKPVDVTLSRDGKSLFVTDELDNRLLVFRVPPVEGEAP